jgi:fibronectin type 3 domain-containing protein
MRISLLIGTPLCAIAALCLAVACSNPSGSGGSDGSDGSGGSGGGNSGGGGSAALAAPTVAASAASSSSIVVAWSSVAGATGYNLYRSSSYSGGYSAILSNTSSLSYSDTALSSGTTYYYEVAALSGSTEGTMSSPASAATFGSLATPSITSVGSATATTLTVSWGAVPGAVAYSVYRDTSPSGSFTTSVGTTAATSLVDSGLSPNSTYYYEVAATNGVDTSPKSAYVSGSTSAAAPSTPSAPTVNPGSSTTSVALSWSSVSGATGYNVYRSANSSSAATAVKLNGSAVTSLSYGDATALEGIDYYYFITAVNGGGESSKSLGSLSYLKLTAPILVSASTSFTGYVYLSWSSKSSAYQFKIYRGGVNVGSAGYGATSYTDYVAAGTYSYTISAIGNAASSSFALRTASESDRSSSRSGTAK